MNKVNVKALVGALEGRSFQERALLLAVVVAALFYLWLTLMLDAMNADQESLARQITVVDSQLIEEGTRYQQIQNSYTDDPNAFARARQRELQETTIQIDDRLNELYGQLILPRQMAIVLTTILQRETSLELLSLENLPPQALMSATVGAAVPLVGEAMSGVTGGGNADIGLRVYRHGLKLEFEGNFLDTIRYLRSLEALDSNFFWEALSFQVLEYPNAKISLNIFTLSTQEGFIGV